MKEIAQLSVILLGIMFGTAFSLCTVVTLDDLFYRRIRRTMLFPILSGVVFGIVEWIQNRVSAGIDLLPLILLHTAAAWFLFRKKNITNFISLVCAELFSGCMISSMQTALFSAVMGAERSFWQVTLLYLISDLAAVLFVLLLKRLVRSEDREPLGLLPVFLLTGITCAVTSLVRSRFAMSDYVPDVSPEAAIPSVLMLMSVTVLLLLSVKTEQTKRFREMSELSEAYMTAQAKHFDQSRDADTEMRMLRHDMKNHIAVMNGLFDAGKTDELGAYLKELGNTFSDTLSVNMTGCEIADAILLEKKKSAALHGANLEIEGSLRGLEINAVILCTVLSNLLDNAIEAAAMTDTDRVIRFSARKAGGFYYICINNPTQRIVDVSQEIPTSKADGTAHGLGLKSVRKAIEKCGGTLELSCKEAASGCLFTAEVILPVR